ncbi:hypothetical protein X566_14280 [Afipia sp. P52-10]|uniref:FAD-dependent oxidoreductase n=1 Tax=Afipia sp. P52-10 TaxID=1429916 RepID=UPI0003DF2334|nr:FAD-dependent oxidoreductase [Afipia sp. P52-10]ETR79132.1 hypothetical protein X566_14280 [Afipia sp. P52-10]
MTTRAVETDVVVIGGNPGGCAAAISAARSGCRVVLLEATSTLGGMNANGVCGFDTARPAALSGLAKEVEGLFKKYYEQTLPDDPLQQRRSDQVWEPHVAARIWTELVADEPHITAICGAVPVAVSVRGGRIARVTWRPASDSMGAVGGDSSQDRDVAARIVVDASYEGDIAAWAGAPFTIGREAYSRAEPHAGVIYSNNLEAAPEGYLAQSLLPGSTGEASDAIMAFSFRMICKLYPDTGRDAAHRLIAPPTGYDAGAYKWTPTGRDAQGQPTFFNTLYNVVNNKCLLNRMAFGNNLAALARDYVLAHPLERGAIRRAFMDHSLGFLYFIQNDGQMPELGLADDEFVDNNHFPRQLYVREGRRIDGIAKLSEGDVNPFVSGDGLRPPLKSDAVAVGDWMIESQGCEDEVRAGYPYPEGFLFCRVTQAPFQIPYGCLLPRGVDNLLVCGAVSATHVAFSALRCEAARIQTGIAAGIAAALVLDLGCKPADVPVGAIQDEVIRRGGQLTYFADVDAEHLAFADIQWAALKGFVPADNDFAFRPDDIVTLAEFVEATVTCLELPISVTGAHFEHIPPTHRAFRYAEALYDLGTRRGVDVFPLSDVRIEDPMRDFIRHDRSPKRIAARPENPIREADAIGILSRVLQSMGRPDAPMFDDLPSVRERWLTRATLCARLRKAALTCRHEGVAEAAVIGATTGPC